MQSWSYWLIASFARQDGPLGAIMLLCFGRQISFRGVKNRLSTHNPVALAHDCGMSAGQRGL
jgi:hypothetical protein